nr:hypothetical protein [Pseudosporangium ferrugineum]
MTRTLPSSAGATQTPATRSVPSVARVQTWAYVRLHPKTWMWLPSNGRALLRSRQSPPAPLMVPVRAVPGAGARAGGALDSSTSGTAAGGVVAFAAAEEGAGGTGAEAVTLAEGEEAGGRAPGTSGSTAAGEDPAGAGRADAGVVSGGRLTSVKACGWRSRSGGRAATRPATPSAASRARPPATSTSRRRGRRVPAAGVPGPAGTGVGRTTVAAGSGAEPGQVGAEASGAGAPGSSRRYGRTSNGSASSGSPSAVPSPAVICRLAAVGDPPGNLPRAAPCRRSGGTVLSGAAG